jgi:hypothetical protein
MENREHLQRHGFIPNLPAIHQTVEDLSVQLAPVLIVLFGELHLWVGIDGKPEAVGVFVPKQGECRGVMLGVWLIFLKNDPHPPLPATRWPKNCSQESSNEVGSSSHFAGSGRL